MTRKSILVFVLLVICFKLLGQVNNQGIRVQVLKDNRIGHKFTFKTEDKTTTELTYLGELSTKKGIRYKVMNSVWLWGQAHRATSRILIFNQSDKYIGNYRLTVIDDLPSSIRSNQLIFTNNVGSDCDPKTITYLNFKGGIPKEIFRRCRGQSGDFYTFGTE